MDPRVSPAIFYYLALASLFSNVSAGGVIYADLHLVPMYAKAHGIIMGLAFVIILPLGAILMRYLSSRGTAAGVWIHAGVQLVGWVLMISGLVMGIKTGKILDRIFLYLLTTIVKLENNSHTIIGTLVVALLLVQPLFGFIHHRRFMTTQKRGKLAYFHVWYGRVLIILGMINGGLGLKLAANTNSGMIAYGVVAGLIGATYLAVMIHFDFKGAGWRSPRTADVALEETNKPRSN